MRRTVSFPDSPARLRVRPPGVPKADRSGERRNGRQTGGVEAAPAAAAAAGPPYKGRVRGKTRPDSSRRPTGHSLIPKENVVEERRWVTCLAFFLFLPSILPTLFPSLFNFFLPCFLPLFQSNGMEEEGDVFFPEADFGTENCPQMADFSRNGYLWGWRRQIELISNQPS